METRHDADPLRLSPSASLPRPSRNPSKLSTRRRYSRYEAEVTYKRALARARGSIQLCIFLPGSDVSSPRRAAPRFLSPPGLTDLQSCREPSSQVHRGPAPRRDDGHPGQGRWMQQLNRVMRIARVKILIGPQLDDVGRLYTVCSLTFDR